MQHNIPYTNEFGQVIEVGEKVISVCTCSHHSYVELGHYFGVNKNDKGDITTVVVKIIPKYSWEKGFKCLPLGRVYKFLDPFDIC
jgi:hypothetical protein